MHAVEYALDALSTRSDVIANNIANAEVPGFNASRVDFEEALARAIDRGRLETLGGADIANAGTAPDAHGNTVQLEEEVVEMMRTRLLQDSMVEAFNFKAGVLRTAIRGG
ncbi:MAG: flagellar biosynthesis protein FlgB [bacterium]|nr:flagellar biosynthesis protein FlgB [bacterium]